MTLLPSRRISAYLFGRFKFLAALISNTILSKENVVESRRLKFWFSCLIQFELLNLGPILFLSCSTSGRCQCLELLRNIRHRHCSLTFQKMSAKWTLSPSLLFRTRRPDGPSEQNLKFSANVWCGLNILGQALKFVWTYYLDFWKFPSGLITITTKGSKASCQAIPVCLFKLRSSRNTAIMMYFYLLIKSSHRLNKLSPIPPAKCQWW